MAEVRFITVPHKTEAILFVDACLGVITLPQARTNAVIVKGGGTVPVEGTVEEILNKLKSAREVAKKAARKQPKGDK